MTEKEIKRRVRFLIARAVRSAAFTEVPDHVMDEPMDVIATWADVCIEVADEISNSAGNGGEKRT